jgi:ABC-2 type transport system permease protein
MNRQSFIRIKALIGKETRQVLRDPSSILIAFVLPFILLILFAYGINMNSENVHIGIAMENDSPAARRLVETFCATSYFDVEVAYDRRELKEKVTSGELRGMVVIPQDFAERLIAGDETSILVITDGSEPSTASIVMNYAVGVLGVWEQAEATDRGVHASSSIELQQRFLYNVELNSRDALVPGSIAIVMAIVGTLLTSLVVAREWERGTMEALLSTPVSPAELLIGKIVPYLVLGFLSMFGSVLMAIFVFGVPYRGGVFAMLLAGGAFLFCALGQGFFISTVTKNQFISSMIALISAFLPAFLLSGFVFEIASMPFVIRLITRIVPARYFVTNLKTLFLVGDVWVVIIPNVLFLLLLSFIFFGVTLRKTSRTLEEK